MNRPDRINRQYQNVTKNIQWKPNIQPSKTKIHQNILMTEHVIKTIVWKEKRKTVVKVSLTHILAKKKYFHYSASCSLFFTYFSFFYVLLVYYFTLKLTSDSICFDRELVSCSWKQNYIRENLYVRNYLYTWRFLVFYLCINTFEKLARKLVFLT